MSQLVFIGDLKQYQDEITGKRKKQYQRLLEQADRYRTMELPWEHPKESTTYMGIAIVNLALAYRLSGKEQYLQDALRFIDTVLRYEKWGNAHLVNVDLSASWILFGLSLGYDWLKPYLTQEQKEKISQKIQHHAKIIFDYRRETYGTDWSTNFYQNHNWINMTGLAAAGYVLQGEVEETQTYIKEAKDDFARVYDLIAEDGSNYEGVTYWRYGGLWLFVYAHLLKRQEGIDYFQKSNYLKNTFYYRLYQSCGDMKQQLNYGDCHDRYSGHTACVYYKAAAEYSDGHAQKLGNMVVDEFLMEEAANSKVKPGILPEAVFEFLWYDPSVPEKDFSDLPLVRYFDDIGLLAMRDSWQRDAKVLTIKCSPPGGKKQWQEGWKIAREEQIDLFSLAHHHPDNLSYLFTNGSEYFTCEDGYNRNIMPDHHNVLLVDGAYTDAVDVNDVYMESVHKRMQADPAHFNPQTYGGHVSSVHMSNGVVIYRGETAGVYPEAFQMEEVSRVLITDRLKFWIFVDLFHSPLKHAYSIICNTDRKGMRRSEKDFYYDMSKSGIHYQVFSDKPIQDQQYEQQVVSVMTTQDPDKVCKTDINTLKLESCEKQNTQFFFECFTFADQKATVKTVDHTLFVNCDGKNYQITVGRCAMHQTPVTISIHNEQGEELGQWVV